MAPASRKVIDNSQDWLNKISKDEIEAVINDVTSFVEKKENEGFAFKCILVLSKLAYNSKCSSPKGLFKLTEACCNAIAPNYAHDQLKLLNALYHVTRFLFKENLLQEAILISENVIKLWKAKGNRWSGDEEKTAIAFTHIFSRSMISLNFSQDLEVLCSAKNKTSALSLWRHLTTLVLCSDKKPFPDLLCILINVSVQCGGEKKDKTAAFLLECLQSFLTSIADNNGSTQKLKLEETVLIRTLRVYRQIVLNYIHSESVSVIKVCISSVLDKMMKVFSCSAEQISSIQFCEKILHFAYRSMLDLNLDAKLLKECLTLMETWKDNSELFYSLSYFMSNVLIKMKVVWARKPPKLPSSVVSLIIKLILKSNKFMYGNRLEVCSEGCKLKCDETTFLQSNCLPFSLLIIFSSQNPDKNETLVKFYASIYKDFEAALIETLDFILNMHEATCPKLPDFYSYLLPFFSNSICGYLSAAQYQNAHDLVAVLLQKFTKLPQPFLEKYFVDKYLIKFTSIICCCCYNLSQFDPPLRILSAWLVILPNRKQVLFKLWTDYKNDAFLRKQTKIKDTIAHILESNSSDFKTNWNMPEFLPEAAAALLLEEVKAYCKYNLSYLEPFISVFEVSQKAEIPIDQDAAMLCFLLRFLTQDTSSLKHLVAVLDRVKELETQLCSLKKKSTTKDKVKINIQLGCLVVGRACCLILKIRSQNEIECVKYSTVTEQPKDHEKGTEVNPNDFCSVTPALSYMKMDKQQQLFELLDEGIKYLSTAASTKALESLSIDTCLLIDTIVDLAHIYKLYGQEAMEYSAWELAFKVSCALKNDEGSIAALINILGLKINVNKKWMDHIDGVVKSLDSSKSFWKFSYTLACIRNSFLKQDYDSVRTLFQEINEEEIMEHRLLYAEYFILLSKCFFNPDISPVNCAVEAYVCLAALVKEKNRNNFTESCKLNCLLFEASSSIGQNYLELMLPRETRHFLKSQLKLAQKLTVPLRLAQVLVQLTWVDIMCCDRSEAQSKIYTLEEILQLKTRVSKLVPIKIPSRRTKLVKIEPPDFLNHENCQCFVCSSSLCQYVIFEAVRLQAAVTNLHPEYRNYCMDFLKCAQNMLEKICRKKKEEWMQMSEIKLFIQYVDYLTLIGNREEAIKISNKISMFISKFPDAHPCQKILKLESFEQAVSLNCGLKMAV